MLFSIIFGILIGVGTNNAPLGVAAFALGALLDDIRSYLADISRKLSK